MVPSNLPLNYVAEETTTPPDEPMNYQCNVIKVLKENTLNHIWTNLLSDIEDDHLLNATYYSPELEERPIYDHHSTNIGMIAHNESPTHVDTASSAGIYLLISF